MKKTFITLFILVLLSSCSVFKETESYEEVDNDKPEASEEVYVFDEVKEDDVKSSEIKDLNSEIDGTLNESENNTNKEVEIVETTTEPVTSVTEESISETTIYEQPVGNVKFYIQLGAFSTLERAERFSSQIDSKVPFGLSIIFDSSNGFYIVRSSPYYTKSEVDIARDDLRNSSEFKDCFIVTE